MSKKKSITEQRNDLRAEAASILAKAKAENRAFTPEEKARFDECVNSVADFDTILDAEAALEKIQDRVDVAAEGATDDVKAFKDDVKAFAKHIRATVNGEVVNAGMGAGDNGAIIPTTIAKKIIKKVAEISPIFARATRYTVKGNVSIPRIDDSSQDVTVAYVDEFATTPDTAVKFASITLTDHEYAALTKISKKLINSSDFDLVNFIVNYMAEKIALFADHECLVGTEGKSKGVIGSYDAEAMKVALASATAVTADELIDLQELVPDAYRPDCEWVMAKETRKAIRKLKTLEGEYLLQRDFSAPSGWSLLGNPVRISSNMPKLGTAGQAVVIFGDYSGLAVKEPIPVEIEILRELFARENAIGVKCYGEIDAQVENTQKFACAVTPGA